MKKIIKLTEKDISQIVKKVLREQTENINPNNLKFGAKDKSGDTNGPVHQLQQNLIDKGFLILRNGPTGYFGNLTQKALDRALGKKPSDVVEKPKKENSNTKVSEGTQGGCPSVGNSPYFRDLSSMISTYKKLYPNFKTDQEVVAFIDRMINRDAQSYEKYVPNISPQGACEVASIGRRSQYDTKNVFIIDSPNKRIYLFGAGQGGKVRPLIAQDIMIDGKNKQRNDVVSVAKAFETYGTHFRNLKEKLKRDPTDDEVWAQFDKDKTRFLPAGIYQGTSVKTDAHYAGGADNLLYIKNWMGQGVGQAVHGYYTGDNRVPFMKKALSIVKDPNNVEQVDAFQKEMKQNGLKMDFSYGCINVPDRFVPNLKKYGPNSFIFNIAEDNQNYLVQNTENYFEKMQGSESCLSPKALGGVDLSTVA